MQANINNKKLLFLMEDPYLWLEKGNDTRVKIWEERQEQNFFSYISQFLDLKEKLKKSFQKLLDSETLGPCIPRKGKYFFLRKPLGKNHHIIFYRLGLTGKEKVALDPNTFSKDGTLALGKYFISPKGNFIAFCKTQSGSDRMPIQVLDLLKNEVLKDYILPIRYSDIDWLQDESGFYYTKWPEQGVEKKEKDLYHVYFHKLGTSSEEDKPLFGKGLTPLKFTDIYLSPDDKYLFLSVFEGSLKNDLYYIDLQKTLVVKPIVLNKDAKFFVQIIEETIFMMTNLDAPHFKIVKFNLKNPEPKKWKNLIPEKREVLESFTIVGDTLVAKYLKSASHMLKLYSQKGEALENIRLPEFGTIDGPYSEWNAKEFFFLFDSFIESPGIYQYDLSLHKIKCISKEKSYLDKNKYHVSQHYYKSKDKTKVPLFLVHKKGLKKTGDSPTLLYAYGGFGINITPCSYFSTSIGIIPFIQEGGIFAVASIRGGGEFGEEWHRAGMREKKQNSFDDFIAAAEYLVKEKYTNVKKLAIEGESNGGLLVASCTIQRPTLFKAVICGVPVTDMLRFHKFDGGSLWIPEYGNPEKKEDAKYLKKYYPKQNNNQGEH